MKNYLRQYKLEVSIKCNKNIIWWYVSFILPLQIKFFDLVPYKNNIFRYELLIFLSNKNLILLTGQDFNSALGGDVLKLNFAVSRLKLFTEIPERHILNVSNCKKPKNEISNPKIVSLRPRHRSWPNPPCIVSFFNTKRSRSYLNIYPARLPPRTAYKRILSSGSATRSSCNSRVTSIPRTRPRRVHLSSAYSGWNTSGTIGRGSFLIHAGTLHRDKGATCAECGP